MRPVILDDLETVAAIYAHYVVATVVTFDEIAPTVHHWRERLDDLRRRRLPFLVADVDGGVAGYAYASPWRPKPAYRHTVEDSIYLAPDWTGRGVGRSLLEALLTECADVGAQQVIAVIADTGDPRSAALHRACGFVDAGRLRRVGRKHGRWVDTLLLQRELAPAQS